MATRKATSSTRLVVEGKKFDLPISVKPLYTSKAGTSGFSLTTVCRVHHAPIRRSVRAVHVAPPQAIASQQPAPQAQHEPSDEPLESLLQEAESSLAPAASIAPPAQESFEISCICEEGGEVINEASGTVKAYDLGGGELVPLDQSQIDALKPPKGDNQLKISHLTNEAPLPEFAAVRVGCHAVQPVGDDNATKLKFQALLALVGKRVGYGTWTTGGKFKWVRFQVSDSGTCLLSIPLYLDEDVRDVPEVKLPKLAPNQAAQFEKAGAEMAASTEHPPVLIDQWREAKKELIRKAARGELDAEQPIVAETLVTPVTTGDLASELL
jgi:non-homologous end joining protein Ku